MDVVLADGFVAIVSSRVSDAVPNSVGVGSTGSDALPDGVTLSRST